MNSMRFKGPCSNQLCSRKLFSVGRTAIAVSKTGKGFGTTQKRTSGNPDGSAQAKGEGKKVVQDATKLAGGRSGHRPIRPEEAARGKLDYVQVADWGDGDRAKLGELRLVSHVPKYEGGAVATAGRNGRRQAGDGGAAAAAQAGASPGGIGGAAGASGGGGADAAPFHMQLARQLQLAESRGALAVAGPPPPPLSEWSFREGRYVQYLTDCLEVHTALEGALREATAAVSQPDAAAFSTPATPPPPPAAAEPSPATTLPPPTTPQSSASDADGTPETAEAAEAAEAVAEAATPAPVQCARHALAHLAPGRLGLERSGALGADLEALRTTAGFQAEGTAGPADADVTRDGEAGPGPGSAGSAAAAASTSLKAGPAAARRSDKGVYDCTAGPMARSYAHVLRRLGRVAGGGETERERQDAALRLFAHAAVLHLVGQAAAVRVGAAATEPLALLQRRAASTYHTYPEGVRDPRATLSAALDAAGAHLAGAAARQAVFDELPGAMQKTGLLMSVLAHRN